MKLVNEGLLSLICADNDDEGDWRHPKIVHLNQTGLAGLPWLVSMMNTMLTKCSTNTVQQPLQTAEEAKILSIFSMC